MRQLIIAAFLKSKISEIHFYCLNQWRSLFKSKILFKYYYPEFFTDKKKIEEEPDTLRYHLITAIK